MYFYAIDLCVSVYMLRVCFCLIYIVKRFDSLKSTDKSLVVVVVVMMMMMIIVVVKNNMEKKKRKKEEEKISNLALHLINISTFSAV